jgi:L-rhamnose 1-dehydrogenase
VSITKNRTESNYSNAGICPFHTFLDMPPEIWEKTRSVNLDGSFYVVQGKYISSTLINSLIRYLCVAAAKQMEKQTPQGGSIIAVSSISALVGGGLQTHYTPTKAGILSLMQSCAVALGKFNIRCNAVLPGMLFDGWSIRSIKHVVSPTGTIATDINKEDLSDVKKREYMESRTCLGRLGGESIPGFKVVSHINVPFL